MPGIMKVFKKGDILFKEGSKGHTFYYIEQGKVEISHIAGGEKTVIDILSKGHSFGEFALLRGNNNIRSATATMLEDSVLVVIDEDSLKEILKDVPAFVLSSMKNVIRKLLKREEDFLKMKKQCQESHIRHIVQILEEKEETFSNKLPVYLKKYTPEQRKDILDYMENLVKICREKYNIS